MCVSVCVSRPDRDRRERHVILVSVHCIAVVLGVDFAVHYGEELETKLEQIERRDDKFSPQQTNNGQ